VSTVSSVVKGFLCVLGNTRKVFDIIRDPLWNNITLDDLAIRLVDTRAFQRLRYVRQLGLAYLVYPGATHTRFEHALGTWHLAGRTLEMLQGRGEIKGDVERDARVVAVAALLHDIGHYPFSHALEEIGAPHHEDVAGALLTRGEIADVLRELIAEDAPERVVELIRGRSASPLQGLISGSLDLDKIEYLKRDALMCGVPYGEIDVDRLIHSLTLVRDPDTGRSAVGVSEKGLSALESLLFAKYQMYRNVYWHHAVRSATAMYKRLVADAIDRGALRVSELASFSDEALLHQLEVTSLREQAPSPLLLGLRERRLFKRAFECPSAELPEDASEWIASDRRLVAAAEDQIARELGLKLGEVLLDYPVKTQMLDLDLLVLRRAGDVRRLTGEGFEGSINLPSLSNELYRSARWLRVFVARPVQLDRKAVMRFATTPESVIRSRVANGEGLLS
jgi:HD superfamily phosphohydrolase